MGIRELRKKEYLRKGELAKVSGTRASTIKYYSELGILPFIQEGERLSRKYERVSSLERLKEIRAFKRKGMTIQEISNLYR
jgi:DNA-binding transcriptional MerR regulator